MKNFCASVRFSIAVLLIKAVMVLLPTQPMGLSGRFPAIHRRRATWLVAVTRVRLGESAKSRRTAPIGMPDQGLLPLEPDGSEARLRAL